MQFAPGDVLVRYTDGITEAQNDQAAVFSEERLLALLKAHLGSPRLQAASAQDIQEAILAAVQRFVGDAPQFDDIALAVLVRDP